MIGAEQQAVVGQIGSGEGHGRHVAAEEVVKPAGGDEFAVHPGEGRPLGIVAEQVEARYVGDLQGGVLAAELFEQDVAEGGELIGQGLGDDRRQVGLGIDAPAVVGGTIEMQRQAGNDQQRAGKVDQQGLQPAVGHGATDPAGQRQVAVEPGIEERAAIHLHPQLQVFPALPVGSRLELQAGAVAVGRQHPEPVFRGIAFPQPEGDQAGIVAHQKIGIAGGQGPALILPQPDETGLLQQVGQRGDRMVRRGCGAQELKQGGVKLSFVHRIACVG